MNVQVLMGQILGFGAIVLGGLLIHRITRVDVTVANLLSGILAGLAIPVLGLDIGLRADHVEELVFFVMLPLLIFEAAWHLKPGLLRRWLVPALILATAGVLISAALTAAGLYFGIGHAQGFPWIAAILAGAILAATDPAAGVAKMRNLHAPEDLTTLFEGESLLNDATAVVLFSLVLAAAQHQAGPTSVTGYFVTVFFGGIAIGLVAGLLTAIAVLLVRESAASVIFLVIAAFGSFYVAEHVFKVSGIMSVMVTAMIARFGLREQEHSFLNSVSMTWDWLGLLMNSLLFALMGLVITLDMFKEQWLAMLIAVIVACAARFVSVIGCVAATRLTRRPIPLTWSATLAWGGLRGAVAIALVLSLPVELPYWWTIQSMVFAVVLFSLLVQGPTSGYLIKRLGKESDPASKETEEISPLASVQGPR
jgi:monovalent cation:H+ antiporter, CPA1 family